MARKQLGTDYVLQINKGTTMVPIWKVATCETSVSLNIPAEIIDARSKCGVDSYVDFGQETVELEGFLLQKDVTDANRMTYKELHTLFTSCKASQSKVQWKLSPSTATVEDEGKVIFTGSGVITALNATFPDNEMSTVTMSLNNDGAIVVTEYVHPT